MKVSNCFFEELKLVEPKTLQLTTEVLIIRKSLEATIQDLQSQINEGLTKLKTLKQEQEVLKRHKNDIKANENFTFEVEEVRFRQKQLNPGTHDIVCSCCNPSRHFPSPFSDYPRRCHWRNGFSFETYSVKVTKTCDELKQKYQTAQQYAEKQKSVVLSIKIALSSLDNRVKSMTKEVRGYFNKLDEITLRRNPLYDLNYIDQLIESERSEQNNDWEKRVLFLQKTRKEANLIVQTVNANYKPWDDFSFVY